MTFTEQIILVVVAGLIGVAGSLCGVVLMFYLTERTRKKQQLRDSLTPDTKTVLNPLAVQNLSAAEQLIQKLGLQEEKEKQPPGEAE